MRASRGRNFRSRAAQFSGAGQQRENSRFPWLSFSGAGQGESIFKAELLFAIKELAAEVPRMDQSEATLQGEIAQP